MRDNWIRLFGVLVLFAMGVFDFFVGSFVFSLPTTIGGVFIGFLLVVVLLVVTTICLFVGLALLLAD